MIGKLNKAEEILEDITEKMHLKRSFLSVLFTFFIDNLGWSIVFPILAPLFLSTGEDFFAAHTSFYTRTIFLGFFLAAFPLAQFFGSPLLGEFADRAGRKKALLISLFLIFVGYFLSAWSITIKNLPLLFFARIITGFFSGNLSVCMATLADLSKDEKAKIKNFSYLSVLGGFSFIFGAFLGGKLSDPEISSLFNPAFPFWVAAILTFLNFFFILFSFKETLINKQRGKLDLLPNVHNISDALHTGKIKIFYLIYFLFLFAWTLLFQFVPVLVVEKFNFTTSALGNLAAFMGVCWTVGASALNKLFVKFFSTRAILYFTLWSFTILCMSVSIPNKVTPLLMILGFTLLVGGAAWPLCTGSISNLASKESQGKVLGITQSMQSLAMTLSPIAGGLAYNQVGTLLPFLLAGFTSLISALLYFKVKLD